MGLYLDTLTDLGNKLNGIGFKISSEWGAAIILAGLDKSHKPPDNITSKLLVLHVPDLAENLLSVYRIVQNGNVVSFDKNGCHQKRGQ
jgi:hypothetical protein